MSFKGKKEGPGGTGGAGGGDEQAGDTGQLAVLPGIRQKRVALETVRSGLNPNSASR